MLWCLIYFMNIRRRVDHKYQVAIFPRRLAKIKSVSKNSALTSPKRRSVIAKFFLEFAVNQYCSINTRIL